MSGEIWECPVCTFHNSLSSTVCEICGAVHTSENSVGTSDIWECPACTYHNASSSFACFVCGNTNPSTSNQINVSQALTPENLEKLYDEHSFFVQDRLVELSHILALSVVGNSEGIYKSSHLDFKFIPVLKKIMENTNNPEISLLACRALNYFIQAGVNGLRQVMKADCIPLYTRTLGLTSINEVPFRDLAREALIGLDYIVSISPECLNPIAEANPANDILAFIQSTLQHENPHLESVSKALRLLTYVLESGFEIYLISFPNRSQNLTNTLIHCLNLSDTTIRITVLDFLSKKLLLLEKYGYLAQFRQLLFSTDSFWGILNSSTSNLHEHSEAVRITYQLLVGSEINETLFSNSNIFSNLLNSFERCAKNDKATGYALQFIPLIGLIIHILCECSLPQHITKIGSLKLDDHLTLSNSAQLGSISSGRKNCRLLVNFGDGSLFIQLDKQVVEIGIDKLQSVANQKHISHRTYSKKTSDSMLIKTFLKFLKSGNAQTARRIISDGFDIHMPISRGLTALLFVASGECLNAAELVQILVEAGADVNACGSHGSALHLAALSGCIDVIDALIACGAAINIRNNEGLRPIDIAKDEKVRLIFEKYTQDEEDIVSISPSKKTMEEQKDQVKMETETNQQNQVSQDVKELVPRVLSQKLSLSSSPLVSKVAQSIPPIPKGKRTDYLCQILFVLEKTFPFMKTEFGQSVWIYLIQKIVFTLSASDVQNYIEQYGSEGLTTLVNKFLLCEKDHILIEKGMKMLSNLIHKLPITLLHKWARIGIIVQVVKFTSLECVKQSNEISEIVQDILQVFRRVDSESSANSQTIKQIHNCLSQNTNKGFEEGFKVISQLLNSPDGLTAFEMVQSGLLESLLSILVQHPNLVILILNNLMDTTSEINGQSNENKSFGFKQMIRTLHFIIASEEQLPIEYTETAISNTNGKDRLLNCITSLTTQFALHLYPHPKNLHSRLVSEVLAHNVTNTKFTAGIKLPVQPLQPLLTLQNFLADRLVITDHDYITYCFELIGSLITRKKDITRSKRFEHLVDGEKWPQEFEIVVGFDEYTGLHLLQRIKSSGKSINEFEQVRLCSQNYRILANSKRKSNENDINLLMSTRKKRSNSFSQNNNLINALQQYQAKNLNENNEITDIQTCISTLANSDKRQTKLLNRDVNNQIEKQATDLDLAMSYSIENNSSNPSNQIEPTQKINSKNDKQNCLSPISSSTNNTITSLIPQVSSSPSSASSSPKLSTTIESSFELPSMHLETPFYRSSSIISKLNDPDESSNNSESFSFSHHDQLVSATHDSMAPWADSLNHLNSAFNDSSSFLNFIESSKTKDKSFNSTSRIERLNTPNKKLSTPTKQLKLKKSNCSDSADETTSIVPKPSKSPSYQTSQDKKKNSPSSGSNKNFQVGDEIEAQFQSPDGTWSKTWFKGRLTQQKDSNFSILFDDQDIQDSTPPSKIRLYQGNQEGSMVQAFWPEVGGSIFSGRITKVNLNDTYNILYEDGEEESDVSKDRILNDTNKINRIWIKLTLTSSIWAVGSKIKPLSHDTALVETENGEKYEVTTQQIMEIGPQARSSKVVQSSNKQVLRHAFIPSDSKVSSAMLARLISHLSRFESGSVDSNESDSNFNNSVLLMQSAIHEFEQNLGLSHNLEINGESELLGNEIIVNNNGNDNNEPRLIAQSEFESTSLEGKEEEDKGAINDSENQSHDKIPDYFSVSLDHENDFIIPPNIMISLFPDRINENQVNKTYYSTEPNYLNPNDTLFSTFRSLLLKYDQNWRASIFSSPVKLLFFVKISFGKERKLSFSPTISPLKFHVSNKQSNDLVPIVLDTENHNNAIKVFVPGSDVFFQALKLLHLFYEDFDRKLDSADPNEIWKNHRLSEKLAVQLSDDIAVVSGAIPEWCDAIVCHSPYLFPLELRIKYFRCTTFGMSRAAAWVQSHNLQNNSQRTRSGTEPSTSNLRGLGGSSRAPSLQISKETVIISRENLLESSDHMMALTGNQSLILEVRFKDEKGIGIGVTASFYTALAQELLVRKNNRNIPLWIDEDRTGDDESFLTYTFGVFPQPITDHFDKKELVLQRFKLLGRIVARALLDEHVFPLCFSAEFLRLVQAHAQFRYFKQDFTHIGQQDASPHQLRLRLSEIPKIYQNTGTILLHLRDACERRRIALSQLENGEKLSESPDNIQVGQSGLTMKEWLEAASLVMADPSSGLCLYPGSEEVGVTIDNVDTYVQMVLDLWCYNGIIKQIDAFIDGLSTILLTHKLCVFSPHELQVLIRGVKDFDWTINNLEQHIVLGHGYTNESEPYRLLLNILSEMTQEEKMDFIAFVTGCPHLPPGGLQSLKPPLEICRRQPHTGSVPLIAHDLLSQVDDVSQQMPFARTCTHTLHLPPYTSPETLKKKVLFAARNSMNLIDRD